ncbi:kinesin-like nuclear fusion protein [Naganishia albida]|nr:kinesin-like nuclear fusion protein [Naganishia albida]
MSSPIKAANDSMIRPPTMLPVSRLPRLNGTPVKTAASAVPVRHEDPAQEDMNMNTEAGNVIGRKRKGPDDEQEAVVSGEQPRSDSLAQGVKRAATGTSRMGTNRTVSVTSGTAPFVPQPRPPSTIRKPINAIGSTTVRSTIGSTAPGSRPGSSLSMASATGTAGRRPVAAASSNVGTRPGMSRITSSSTSVPGLRTSRTASNFNLRGLASSQVGVPSASRLNRSVMSGASSVTGVKRVSPGSRSVLGRSVGPGSRARSVMMDFEQEEDPMASRMAKLEAMVAVDQENMQALKNGQQELQARLNSTQNDEREARRNLSTAGEEMAAMREKHRDEVDELERKLSKKERERKDLEDDCRDLKNELESSKGEVRDLKAALSAQVTSQLTVQAELSALRATNTRQQQEIEGHLLSVQQAEQAVSRANERVKEVEDDLRTAETIRRKLHNQVQELKGNIRVFARVRPPIGNEVSSPDDLAEMEYPAKGVVTASGQEPLTIYKSRDNAEGRNTREAVKFSFDKVFQPEEGQKEVFEEISMLAQSVLDGYNVCIFAYGQTGSGKSWTMEGGSTSETAGMIPRAIAMIFRETEALKELGWQYAMTGQFVEIYNEKINDLFGNDSFDSAKHEVRHEGSSTSVTGITPCPLESADQVASLMIRASGRRAVAATMMNERSSRSHSVFSLKVKGYNPLTNESCEGVLNLVDLAGSERLDKAGTGEHRDRMKETININKSLSSLQNVIQKLSEKATDGKTHVNYRDSQLTYLLQNSLSGSSKTLMFCNLSPLAVHTSETLNSLRFATKVNSTVIGSAKRQAR